MGRTYIKGGPAVAKRERAKLERASAMHVKALQEVVKRHRVGALHDGHVRAYRALSEAEWYAWRYRTDLAFAIKERLRRQMRKKLESEPNIAELIRRAVKDGGASGKIEAICGYSVEQLKSHLERQFTKGMTWNVWSKGGIHIDHILPKKCFDLSTIEGTQAYWSLSNLRPLWAKKNLEKSSKIEHLC
jgi:hypothetical protein